MLKNLWWRDTCHVGTLSLGYRGVPWRQVLLYYQNMIPLWIQLVLISTPMSMVCVNSQLYVHPNWNKKNKSNLFFNFHVNLKPIFVDILEGKTVIRLSLHYPQVRTQWVRSYICKYHLLAYVLFNVNSFDFWINFQQLMMVLHKKLISKK